MDAFLLAGQSNMALIHDLLEVDLKTAYGSDTIVIKSSVGSTSVSQWQPSQSCYNDALTACQSAIQQGAVFRGVLWSQGEADTVAANSAYALTWKQKYYNFLTIRGALGNSTMPAVHTVLGFKPTIGTPRPGWDEVIQQQVLAQKLPNLAIVGMSDFEYATDGLHIAIADRPDFAQRLCDAMKRLAP